MLVLSRDVGEELIVGTDIRIAVVYVRGDRVGIGVEAPRELTVRRGESEARENGDGNG